MVLHDLLYLIDMLTCNQWILNPQPHYARLVVGGGSAIWAWAYWLGFYRTTHLDLVSIFYNLIFHLASCKGRRCRLHWANLTLTQTIKNAQVWWCHLKCGWLGGMCRGNHFSYFLYSFYLVAGVGISIVINIGVWSY